jgi:uncharacterized membrane-anchored protein
MRNAIAIVAGILILAAVNVSIYSRERHLAEGAVVLLELAPVDPRSLMQGDYMALRFKVEVDAVGARSIRELSDGRLIVKVDDRGVGKYVRRDGGESVAADELALRYRVRDGKMKFATNAFFFEEGTAREYEQARYGEFRVAPNGDLLLTHLRGENLDRLGPR